MKLLSKEIKEQILVLFDKGFTTYQIAKILPIAEKTAREYVKKSGRQLLNVRKHLRVLSTGEKIQEAALLYNSGYSFSDLAKKYQCSINGIRDLLLKEKAVISRGNKDLTGKDYNKRHSCNDLFFDKIDSEKKAYWLGYLFADGYNNQKENSVSFSQSEPQEEMVYRFKEDLEATQTISIDKQRTNIIHGKEITSKPAHRIKIISKQLSDDLAKHGCIQGKTFTIAFPNIDDQFKSHFIRGYFDGDGSVTNVKNTTGTKAQFNIIGTLDLLLGIQEELVKKAGLNAIKISPARKDSQVYQLVYGGIENVKKFHSYLYSDSEIYLPKKKNIFESVLKLYKDRDDNKDSVRQEKLEEIISLFIDGKSFRSIEKLTNVSRNTFSQYITDEIKEQAIRTRNKKILDLYNEGLSARQIEKQLHIARSTIYSIIKN